MSKTVLGFDIGESNLKIVQQGSHGMEIHSIQMPDNLVQDGIVQMPHMMTDFLKGLKKEYGLPGGQCGLIVPDELVVCRNLTLPAMTEKQLEVNLPFEFSDYISGEPQKYVYDYAVQEMICNDAGEPVEMRLTGAVMSKDSVTSYVNMFKNAGFKLRTLIPQEISLKNIMKVAVEEGRVDTEKEYCIVNLGHRGTQVYIFKGAELTVFRSLHIGGRLLDEAIAESRNVDTYVARNYKNKNYNGVLDSEAVQEAYARIAVEVRKVINFYRFNNRESTLENMYFIGGGSNIPALCDSIAEINDLKKASMYDLLPKSVSAEADMIGVLAMGVLLQ